ncbi:hypothetical protein KK101_01420 [Curtobacterium flaccumfaciens pv. oortii]|uniref:hypothetical protein n=1 Tax=Curtobacterium flaccumfaciens TaxID=2035 RepID=UPI001BDEB15D|nr:hypothetical protein [Curtobacterium flaccumfaciens]MBT1621348.1 hypothetical protein [Curtobacterium flaccumfaciens pv. oortii]
MRQPHTLVRSSRIALAVIAAAAAALSPVVVASAATAAPGAAASTAATPAADFTAGVRSINHGLGIVTVAGTGPVGGSIAISGDGVESVSTEVRPGGAWSAEVRVGRGERVVRVTSLVTGTVIDLPVVLRTLTPPGMLATVDGIARTISIEGEGYPGAHFVIKDNGTTAGEADVDVDGSWSFTLHGLSFGQHHVEAFQYFDGTQNGGVDEDYTVSGAAVVTTATASRETERVALAGRAPVGTTLRFSDQDGPVVGADGRPVTVATAADSTWHAEVPFPAAARFHRVTVTTYEGAEVLGTTEARVTVPIALTGTAEELPDGSVKLSGSGEIGGVVSLEDDHGKPLRSSDGQPIATMTGSNWELVVPRSVLPEDVVVARQRVDGVEQGALRLVLPRIPVRPAPTPGQGPDAGVSVGTHPAAQHAAAGQITVGTVQQLAYTGNDPRTPIGIAVALLTAGLAGLGASRVLRGRAAHRD